MFKHLKIYSIINFRCPSWKKTEQLADLSLCLKELKQVISKMNKRTFLSITPKVEDLKLVYAWVKLGKEV